MRSATSDRGKGLGQHDLVSLIAGVGAGTDLEVSEEPVTCAREEFLAHLNEILKKRPKDNSNAKAFAALSTLDGKSALSVDPLTATSRKRISRRKFGLAKLRKCYQRVLGIGKFGTQLPKISAPRKILPAEGQVTCAAKRRFFLKYPSSRPTFPDTLEPVISSKAVSIFEALPDPRAPELDREGFIPTLPISVANHNVLCDRYRNILPYDENMWRHPELNVDYFNGSKIRLTNSRVVVATQAPKKETLSDFVKLCQADEVELIVTIGLETENLRTKMLDYWSHDSNVSPDITGSMSETLVNEDGSPSGINLRVLRFASKERPELAPRHILHIHYRNWPDHGVPNVDEFHRLVEMVAHNMSQRTDLSKISLVVHCSAGVGRTGAFLSALKLYMQKPAPPSIEKVAEIVASMRKERARSVQTQKQFDLLLQYDRGLNAVENLGATNNLEVSTF